LTTFKLSVFEAAGAALKIDLSLKPKHRMEILFAQIRETLRRLTLIRGFNIG